MTAEERLEHLTQEILNKMIVARNSNFYKVEQAIISILCVFSSYFYMYCAAFGQEHYQQLYAAFEIIFSLDFILMFFVESPCY